MPPRINDIYAFYGLGTKEFVQALLRHAGPRESIEVTYELLGRLGHWPSKMMTWCEMESTSSDTFIIRPKRPMTTSNTTQTQVSRKYALKNLAGWFIKMSVENTLSCAKKLENATLFDSIEAALVPVQRRNVGREYARVTRLTIVAVDIREIPGTQTVTEVPLGTEEPVDYVLKVVKGNYGDEWVVTDWEGAFGTFAKTIEKASRFHSADAALRSVQGRVTDKTFYNFKLQAVRVTASPAQKTYTEVALG